MHPNFSKNYFKFLALIATADEYYQYIKDDMVTFLTDEYTKTLPQEYQGYDAELVKAKQIREFRKLTQLKIDKIGGFFKDYLNKLNSPDDEVMLDNFIDTIHNALQEIDVEVEN